MKIGKITAGALVLLASSGCATMFGRTTDDIQFDSEPEGATVEINGEKLGVTPVKVTLAHKTERTVAVFRKQGYSTQEVMLSKTIAGAAFLNVVFITTTFGAPSVGTDASTGHLMTYSPKSYVVQLEDVSSGKSTSRTQSPLEFSITNYDVLRQELAAGKGQMFTGLCGTYSMKPAQCDAFYGKLLVQRESLDRLPDSLAWYRGVDLIARR